MVKKYKICLLIDDNPLDNYTHELLIYKTNFANDVVALESGEEALLALKTGSIKPDVIFLDINMPVMNGFEFLEKYAKLDLNKESVKIFTLSSSLNPLDIDRANQSPYISKYIQKTLTEEKLQELMKF